MVIELLFNRRNKLDKNGRGSVDLYIFISRTQRKFVSTGVKVDPSFWDEKKKMVKSKHPESQFLNFQIAELRREYEKLIITQQMDGNGYIELDRPKKSQETTEKTEEITFYTFFEEHVIKTVNTELVKATNYTYKRALRYLREYHPSDPTFDELTVIFFDKFNQFLIEKKELSQNSRAVLFKKIKKVLHQAERNDLLSLSKNPFSRGFAVREIEPEKKSLTLKELQKLENLDMKLRPELETTRDMFLFACYTSLRYGDLTSLTSENFTLLTDGKIRLSYLPNKTSHHYKKRIEWITSDFWNGRIDAIVKKYLSKREDRQPFFQYSNAFYNRNLKELQRFSGIKTILTSHLARHTCITLLINDFAMDITKVQMIAGHSKIEMTRTYLRITEQDLSTAAQRVNWNI